MDSSRNNGEITMIEIISLAYNFFSPNEAFFSSFSSAFGLASTGEVYIYIY
jgi:hypothetical protein